MIFGALAAAFALIAEIIVFGLPSLTDPHAGALFDFGAGYSFTTFLSLLGIALIEEGSKLLFLLSLKRYPFLTKSLFPIGTIGNSVLFGIGFWLPEAALAEMSSAFSVSLLATLALHVTTSICLGFLLKNQTKLLPNAANIWLISAAVCLHFLYNFLSLSVR